MPANGVARFEAICRVALLTAALFAVIPAAQSQDALGGSLVATTDYIYRGLSQSAGRPAMQGGIHYRFGDGWVLGAWASTVDLNPGPTASFELDAYLMRSWVFNADWDARVGVTHYAYPNDPRQVTYDYDEATASLSFRRRLTASVTWSPNTSRRAYIHGRGFVTAIDRTPMSSEATFLQPVTESWSLNAGAGYYDIHDLFETGYWYWNTGIVYSRGALQLDVSRIDSENIAADLFSYRAAGSRWSAAVTWRF
jgi:uncharacterized protein (TIGR02001 family)